MKTILSLLFVAVPKLFAGGGQFFLTLLLLRGFDPTLFGTLSVCLTAILLCDAFLGSAVDMAVLRLAAGSTAKDRGMPSLQVQKAGLIFKPFAIGVLAIPLTINRGELSLLLFQRRDFSHLIVLTFAALAAILVLRSVQTFFQVGQRFGWYGGADFVHNLLRYGMAASLVGLGSATPGRILAIYALAPTVVAGGLLLFPARALIRVRANGLAFHQLGRVLAWFIPAAAVGGITSRMDIFFVSHQAGVKDAGIFAAAQAVGLPMLLLGTYLGVVFGPRIMTQFGDGTLRAFYRRFQLWTAGLAIVGYALLVMGKIWFSTVIFPRSFEQSALILVILFPALLAGLINFPLTISLLLFLKPKFIFAVDAVGIPVLWAAYSLVIPRYGVAGAAAVTTVYAMAKLAVFQLSAWQLLNEGHRKTIHQHGGGLQFSEGF